MLNRYFERIPCLSVFSQLSSYIENNVYGILPNLNLREKLKSAVGKKYSMALDKFDS